MAFDHRGEDMDFETAREIALVEFRSRHGEETDLDFVTRFVTVGGRRASDDHWVIELLIHPRIPLEEEFQREVVGGRSVLTRISAKTGKKEVVIHWRGVEAVTIFRAFVHEVTAGVTVELDREPSGLNGTDYEPVGAS